MYSALQRIFSTFLCLQMPKKPFFSDYKKDIIRQEYVLLRIEHFALEMKLQPAFPTGIALSTVKMCTTSSEGYLKEPTRGMTVRKHLSNTG